jgi:dienelactone hydrolase
MDAKHLLSLGAGVCTLALHALTQSAEAAPTRPDAAVRAALRSAPFFTEIFVPPRRALGVVITFHRGAWSATGSQPAATEHPDDHAWLRRHWLVVNSSYRPGVAGLSDARSVYRRVNRAVHGELPICMVGASSGGNLALLAATRLPTLACVVAEAAPVDLVNIASEVTYDPNADGGASSTGPAYVHDAAAQALGADNLRAFSPLFMTERIEADVLVADAEQDPLIPPQQLSDFCARLSSRCAGFLRMAPGPLSFVHAGVDRAALSQFRQAETSLAHRVLVEFAAAQR